MQMHGLFTLSHLVLTLDNCKRHELNQLYLAIYGHPSSKSSKNSSVVREIARAYMGPGQVLICHESSSEGILSLFCTLDAVLDRVFDLRDLSYKGLSSKYTSLAGEKVVTTTGAFRHPRVLEMAFHVYRASFNSLHTPLSLRPLVGLHLPIS
jgi:hypothetical protein